MSATTKESHHFFKSYPADQELQDIKDYLSLRRFFLFSKRIFDMLISSLVIIFLLSWFLPLLAILIKLDSRGPVFFVQRRVGFLGKSFFCIKLRTMIVNVASDHQQAISDDPRITRIGKFLRITSLDEFPQFFNVFLGEMSIVGPRPHMHKDNDDFEKIVDNYQLRSYIKPGITGIAQLKGCRGPAKNFYSIFHRYQWDAFYIRNANFSLDIKIIRLTAAQMVRTIFIFWSNSKKENQKDLIEETPAWVMAKTSPQE